MPCNTADPRPLLVNSNPFVSFCPIMQMAPGPRLDQMMVYCFSSQQHKFVRSVQTPRGSIVVKIYTLPPPINYSRDDEKMSLLWSNAINTGIRKKGLYHSLDTQPSIKLTVREHKIIDAFQYPLGKVTSPGLIVFKRGGGVLIALCIRPRFITKLIKFVD